MTSQNTTAAGIFYTIGDVEFTLNSDGSLTMDAHRRGQRAATLGAADVYSLYVFLAKLPHVGAMLERLEASRQDGFFVRMANDLAKDEQKHKIVQAEHDRVKGRIYDRHPHQVNETGADYCRVEIARALALAEYYDMIGDDSRAAFQRHEAATNERHLADELAEEAAQAAQAVGGQPAGE